MQLAFPPPTITSSESRDTPAVVLSRTICRAGGGRRLDQLKKPPAVLALPVIAQAALPTCKVICNQGAG